MTNSKTNQQPTQSFITQVTWLDRLKLKLLFMWFAWKSRPVRKPIKDWSVAIARQEQEICEVRGQIKKLDQLSKCIECKLADPHRNRKKIPA